MKLKMCGVRRVQDALLCAQAGADEVGVIFARQSKRCIAPDLAREIRRSLPPAVGLVGVFLDATAAELETVLQAVDLNAIQLHGAIPPRLPGIAAYVALHVEGPQSLPRIRELSFAARILLDSPKGGGSGHAFPWALARTAREFGPRELFVAGGLDAANVATAIREARPDGVDVASGIEGADGFKDPQRIIQFANSVRNTQ